MPDDAKTAIVEASFYEPEVNRTYAEMAAHYGTAILPARTRKPRDKSKVEQAVLIVERWLLGRLRRRIFTSLADADAALAELMAQLNDKEAFAGSASPAAVCSRRSIALGKARATNCAQTQLTANMRAACPTWVWGWAILAS